MKTNLYTIAVLVLLCLATNVLDAKKKTFEGFVVTNQDDTIFGYVYYISPTVNELSVKIEDKHKKCHSFKAKSLKSYSFKVSKYNKDLKKHVEEWVDFVAKTVEDAPIHFGTKSILIQRQTDGAIKVFSQYYEIDSKIGVKLEHCYYIEKANNELAFTKVTKSNYKKVLKMVTKDHPALSEKIGTKGYSYKHITKIAKLYN